MSAKLFHSNLKILRRKAKLSQKAFSEKIGVEMKRYQKWEEERSQPDIENIETIARTHNIPVDVLLNLDLSQFS